MSLAGSTKTGRASTTSPLGARTRVLSWPAMTWAFVATRPRLTTQPEPWVPTSQAVPSTLTTAPAAARAPALLVTLGSGGGSASSRPGSSGSGSNRLSAWRTLAGGTARSRRGKSTDSRTSPRRPSAGWWSASTATSQPTASAIRPPRRIPPSRSTTASEDRAARNSRTGRPSAAATVPRKNAPTRAPTTPAIGSQAELSGKRNGATSEPTTAPSARPPSERACAASPRWAPRIANAATASRRRTSAAFTPEAYGRAGAG
jgi:hypothetical protein